MRSTILLVLTLASASQAIAQSSLPPVRKLGPVQATSPRTYGAVSVIQPLPNGRLLINDPGRPRRLVLADTMFRELSVVADTNAGSDIQFGLRSTALTPFAGDSVLFIETMTPAMYVITPEGKPGRMMSVPNPREASWLANTPSGAWPGIDARGRLIYRGQTPRPPAGPRPGPGELLPYSVPDSAPIVRADPVTRAVETIGWFKTRKLTGTQVGRADGTSITYLKNDPLASGEDYTVLADGIVAILRSDYHLDLIDADGRVTSTPRIPYPWERMTDDGKVALMDSVKKAYEQNAAASGAGVGTAGSAIGGGGGGGSSGLSSGGAGRPAGPPPDYAWAKPSELPDYRPAFTTGALRADARGNIWIRTLQPTRTPGTAIYDVVTREGKLIDRVEIDANLMIVGFDATSVYLAGREGGASWIERIRLQ